MTLLPPPDPCPQCGRSGGTRTPPSAWLDVAPGPGDDRFAAAVAFAAHAHAGQTYDGHGGRPDQPYIFHPVRVAMDVHPPNRVAAVLHDCLEDAGILPRWLTDDERAAISLLTRDKENETYDEYIGRILATPNEGPGWTARDVKRADVRDNLIHDPPDRLRERYERAQRRLCGIRREDG